MGGHSGGTAGIIGGMPAAPAPARDPAPEWDRFAVWRPGPARISLAILLVFLVLSAIVPVQAGKQKVETAGFVENIAGMAETERERDEDLALYDVVTERLGKGENYYDFIVEEQRKARYPVRPGIAVRLPTLAYINAALGEAGQIAAAVLLMIAVMVVWWRRLGDEPGAAKRRLMLVSLLFLGTSLGVNRYYFALHELWAGMLLALSFGLHRPGKWGAALAVAALAVAIRELALPFVLLMGAMAFWRRDWKEGAAWSALAVVFVAALAVHLSIIAQYVRPDDPFGQGWLALRGLSGWISNLALSSNLRFLPHWLAGPAVILMVFGWMAWKSPAGLFGTFLYLGYGMAFAIAGRGDNFYWGMVIAPTMFMGLAFVPMGLRSLIGAASAK